MLEPGAERAAADDLQPGRGAASGEQAARLDEVLEALLLDQARDRQDEFGTAGLAVRRSQPAQVGGVRDELDPTADHPAQVGAVRLADGGHERRVAELLPQSPWPRAPVVDVFRVRGDAVGRAVHPVGEVGETRRRGGEVGVDVVDARPGELLPEHGRLE